MSLSTQEIYDLVLYQIGALHAFARSARTTLVHVKPHGALYNRAAEDRPAAEAIARAIYDFDPGLILVGLAGSASIQSGLDIGLRVAREAFADRAYTPNATLVARTVSGAVHTEPARVVAQAMMIARDRKVSAIDGATIDIDADTICLHGDSRGAADLARRIRTALGEAGVQINPLHAVLNQRA